MRSARIAQNFPKIESWSKNPYLNLSIQLIELFYFTIGHFIWNGSWSYYARLLVDTDPYSNYE